MERLLAWTAEQGSRQLVWGALAHQDHPDTLRGEFSEVSRVQEVSDFVLSDEGAKVEDRVWVRLGQVGCSFGLTAHFPRTIQ